MNKYLLTFALPLFFSLTIKCQDTTGYTRAPNWWTSESYFFITSRIDPAKGRFLKLMDSDDGQSWVGGGTFNEDGNMIELSEYRLIHTREYAHLTPQLTRIVDSIHVDTLNVPTQFFRKKGNTILLIDASQKEEVKYMRLSEEIFNSYRKRLNFK